MKSFLLFCIVFLSTTVQAKTIEQELKILNSARDYIYHETINNKSDWELYSKIAYGIAVRQKFLEQIHEDRYILVNKSDYHLRLIDNKKEIVYEKVIVGRASRPTPEFSKSLTHVVLNPYWNVPFSLTWKDVIPSIRRKPAESRLSYIHHKGYRFFLGDSELAPEDIDWNNLPNRVHIRQDPGKLNSLGRIKFMLPNNYHVYIHDTPSKGLFNKNKRNFSSGCVRLQNPQRLAAALLDKPEKYILDKIADLSHNHNKWIKLNQPTPVHIVDWSVWVTANGEVKFQ